MAIEGRDSGCEEAGGDDRRGQRRDKAPERRRRGLQPIGCNSTLIPSRDCRCNPISALLHSTIENRFRLRAIAVCGDRTLEAPPWLQKNSVLCRSAVRVMWQVRHRPDPIYHRLRLSLQRFMGSAFKPSPAPSGFLQNRTAALTGWKTGSSGSASACREAAPLFSKRTPSWLYPRQVLQPSST